MPLWLCTKVKSLLIYYNQYLSQESWLSKRTCVADLVCINYFPCIYIMFSRQCALIKFFIPLRKKVSNAFCVIDVKCTKSDHLFVSIRKTAWGVRPPLEPANPTIQINECSWINADSDCGRKWCFNAGTFSLPHVSWPSINKVSVIEQALFTTSQTLLALASAAKTCHFHQFAWPLDRVL